MSPWSQFPLVRILIVFIAGLLSHRYIHGLQLPVKLTLGLFIFLYTILLSYTHRKNFYRYQPLLGLLGLTCIFLLGILFPTPPLSLPTPNKTITAYEGYLISPPKKKPHYTTAILQVRRIRIQNKWKSLNAKVKLYIRAQKNNTLQYGDVLMIQGSPKEISIRTNQPSTLYRLWLLSQNIHLQHSIREGCFQKVGFYPSNWFRNLALKSRNSIIQLFKNHIHDESIIGVALAMMIGERGEIQKETQLNYAQTGTIHILAVSGLHVGILYSILISLLYCLRFLPFKRKPNELLAVGLLWGYAFLTAFSPSILRATIMFSFSIFAKLFRLTYNAYNILPAAGFILLMYDPNYIYSLGFQLSFLSVWGILYLTPKLVPLITSNNYFIQKGWLLTATSIAAQLFTLPLSLYYFHQLPTYFIIANWVVVPGAFVVVVLGLIFLLSTWNIYLHTLLCELFKTSISWMNHYVSWVSKLPLSSITIEIDFVTMILCYCCLGSLILLLQYRRFQHMILLSSIVLLHGAKSTWTIIESRMGKIKPIKESPLQHYVTQGKRSKEHQDEADESQGMNK